MQKNNRSPKRKVKAPSNGIVRENKRDHMGTMTNQSDARRPYILGRWPELLLSMVRRPSPLSPRHKNVNIQDRQPLADTPAVGVLS